MVFSVFFRQFCHSLKHSHFSLYRNTEKKKVSHYPVYEYFGYKYTFFLDSQEFGRCFPIHSNGHLKDILNFDSTTAPAYVQLKKLFGC